MNVNAAKCRITANSYGHSISPDGTHLNLSEYPQVIANFEHLIEDERKRRVRRCSYNTYDPDFSSTDKQKIESSSSYRGWPENRIPWGKHSSDRVIIENGTPKQDRVYMGNKRFNGRPQSSPGSSRRPYKHESVKREVLKERKERPLGGNTIRLIYKRPPAPEPPADKVAQASVKSALPQSLIIVLGKTTPMENAQSESNCHNDMNGQPRKNIQPKLPSYYLGDLGDIDPERRNSPHTIWSSSFSFNSTKSDQFDNFGGFSRFDVGDRHDFQCLFV